MFDAIDLKDAPNGKKSLFGSVFIKQKIQIAESG